MIRAVPFTGIESSHHSQLLDTSVKAVRMCELRSDIFKLHRKFTVCFGCRTKPGCGAHPDIRQTAKAAC